MKATLLRETGEALYGPRWQTDLARDLGVSDRTMRRWAAGADDMPAGVAVDLLRLVTERGSVLDTLADRLKPAAAG